jgi:signal transduction histidine kinase
MALQESVRLVDQIKVKISHRILLCLLSFFIVIIGLTIFDIAKSFKELGDLVNAQCQSLEDYTVGQALIDNQPAVQLKLDDYNATNPYKISWVPTGTALNNDSIHWLPLLSWEYNYQIKSVAGQDFGYFHVSGSILNDRNFFSELLGRILLMIFFALTVFALLYPLANKIPQQLFIEPINNLLQLLKTGVVPQAAEQSQKLTVNLSMELMEIQDQIIQLLSDITKKTRMAALGELAAQVAHDIKSPTASLLVLAKTCQQLPEKDRVALREAAIRIQDIANNLLTQFKQKDVEGIIVGEERQLILASASMLQLLSEKKLQYQDLPIQFDYKFSSSGSFAFIKIEPTAFNRMLSNIINNAVEAFDKKAGRVILNLDADNEWVRVVIEDDGKGMSAGLVKKLMSNLAITEGKQDGHGIGLTQVWEALERNQGEFAIDSKIGKGTKIILTFPRLMAPNWIAEEIKLGSQDFVIILDDDSSIHFAWDTRFESILAQAPGIRVQHFQNGLEALEVINQLSVADKQKLFLLTDYELLNQELHGLDVVARAQVHHSVLVTSHYTNKVILDAAAATGTKILPKQLVPEIPIVIDATVKYVDDGRAQKKFDAIVVDDDQNFAAMLIMTVFDGQEVAHYTDPRNFLKNVSKYPKDIKIFLDNNFATGGMRGMDIAAELHQLGYTRLYMLSGEIFDEEDIPEYLIVIGKDKIDLIHEIK